jgi:hypothetical protein
MFPQQFQNKILAHPLSYKGFSLRITSTQQIFAR